MRLIFGFLIGLALFSASAGPAAARAPDPKVEFPTAGTTYAKAKQSLLAQGAKVAPDQPQAAHTSVKEVDCGEQARGRGSPCRALFIVKDDEGWGQYVVVSLTKDLHVVSAAFGSIRPDLVLPVPPPPPADAPKLSRSYLGARTLLRKAGYEPLGVEDPVSFCSGPENARIACRLRKLRETQCFMDIPICNAFWRAPDGRVLWIEVLGEAPDLSVRYAGWGKDDADLWPLPKETRAMLRRSGAFEPTGGEAPKQ